MTSGVYERTEEHRRAISEGMLQSPELQKPRSQKQIEHTCGLGKLPRTLAQIENNRRMGHIVGKLPNRDNGFENKPLMGTDLVKHHNDLQHGAIRPDDINIMTSSEHLKLHARLRIEDGTHNLLAHNR